MQNLEALKVKVKLEHSRMLHVWEVETTSHYYKYKKE